MALSSELISQFVKATKDSTTTKGETIVYGTVKTDESGSQKVQLDGSDIYTPVSFTVDAKAEDRVIVMIKNHTATVTGNLTARSARFETVADKVSTQELNAEIANVKELIGDSVTTEELNAEIANVTQLVGDKADISDLQAAEADIVDLKADVADIDTLIFGSAAGTTIQTSFANAVVAQLGNAQIKSAMIESISAGKITAGDIITNNVRVMSNDGKLIISDETIQISDSNRVRVQIGKDASGDYSIYIWDADGNLMFNEGGITDSAIKDAIIRNDMVSETANISASKLDIDSLFEEINGGSNTIKATKVKLDESGQTLEVAFTELDTKVTDQGDVITSQGTAVSTIQGQIASKIWQQDIDTATTVMSTQYSTLEQNLTSFKSTVGSTYATKTELGDIAGGDNIILGSKELTSIVGIWADLSKVILDNGFVAVRCYGAWHGIAIDATDIIPRFKNNDKLTLSFNLKSSGAGRVGFYALCFNADWNQVQPATQSGQFNSAHIMWIPEGEQDVRYAITFPVTQGWIDLVASGGTVKWTVQIAEGATGTTPMYMYAPKLERGATATDWCPSIYDIDGRFNATESSITQLSDRITSNVTETTELGTRVSVVEQTANELTVQLEDLKIGGRNLLLGTKDFDGDSWVYKGSITSFTASGTYDNLAVLQCSTAWHAIYQPIEAVAGEKYTISAYIKATDGTEINYYTHAPNGTVGAGSATPSFAVVSVTTGWQRFTVSLTVTKSGILWPRFEATSNSSWWICGMKLERGDKATDWTPAPEDVDADILGASKSATNYLNFSSSGLVVGDMTASSLGKNILIDSEAIKVRSGTGVNAVFGADKIELAKNNASATISMLNDAFKIYYDADNSDGGFGIYGKTSSGAERLAFQAVNENDNLTLGWGGYAAKANSTNLYGHKIYLTTNDDIIMNPGSGNVHFDGNVVLSNGKNLFGKRTDGIMRSMAILNASNQMLFGYGSYSNSEGSVFYDGNDVTVRSKNNIRLTTQHETVMLQDGDGGATYNAFFKPNSDAKCTLGTNANRWYAVYASNGTVQTSDAREKENIKPFTDIHSDLFDKLQPVQFNFIDGNGRTCYGLLSQDVISAMAELGIDENELDLVHHDVFVDETTGKERDTFGISYFNLIALLIHEVQKLKSDIKNLKPTKTEEV